MPSLFASRKVRSALWVIAFLLVLAITPTWFFLVIVFPVGTTAPAAIAIPILGGLALTVVSGVVLHYLLPRLDTWVDPPETATDKSQPQTTRPSMVSRLRDGFTESDFVAHLNRLPTDFPWTGDMVAVLRVVINTGDAVSVSAADRLYERLMREVYDLPEWSRPSALWPAPSYQAFEFLRSVGVLDCVNSRYRLNPDWDAFARHVCWPRRYPAVFPPASGSRRSAPPVPGPSPVTHTVCAIRPRGRILD
jgi:hypothetical protein